jgi:hypothetical protein
MHRGLKTSGASRNQRNTPGTTPERTWNYKQLEAALAEIFEVAPGRARGTGNLLVLRGRLKSFQRVGLTPSSPGRGKVIRYRINDIYTWALGLALADFGLGPESIARILEQPWVDGYYTEALRSPKGEHLFFVLSPYVLRYTAFRERETQYVIMRGSQISGKNITALGGRAALIDITFLLDKIHAKLCTSAAERPNAKCRSRALR